MPTRAITARTPAAWGPTHALTAPCRSSATPMCSMARTINEDTVEAPGIETGTPYQRRSLRRLHGSFGRRAADRVQRSFR